MEQAAFRSFYLEAAPKLRAYIARSVGSVHAADDILQDVFMRFLLKAPSSLSEAEMRGYLYRTAETLIVDRWRQRRRETTRDVRAAEPGEEAVQPELDGDLDRALRELKPQQRSLLWLAYVEELNHREIAAALGLSDKSVRVLLARARQALAGVLSKFGWGSEAANAQ